MPVSIRNIPSQIALNAFFADKGIFILPCDQYLREKSKILLQNSSQVIWDEKLFTLNTFTQFLSNTAKPAINTNLKRFIILDLMNTTELKHFERVKELPQICNEFVKAISVLRENQISADMLEKELTYSGSLKEFDLLTIYKKYEDFLSKNNLFDRGSIYAKALESNQNKFEHIIIEGFDYLPHAFKKLIKHLELTTNIEIITQPPTLTPAIERFSKFQNLNLKELGLQINHIWEKSDKWQVNADISFHSCRSVMNETRFIASKIKELLNKGLSNEEISIITPENYTYLNELLLSLHKFNITQDPSLLLFNGKTNKIKSIIKSSISIEELTNSVQSFGKTLYSELNNSTFEYHASNNLNQLNSISDTLHFLELLPMLNLELEQIKKFLLYEVTSKPAMLLDLQSLPFKLSFWGKSVGSNHKTLFIPNFCQGIIPPEPKPSIFFQDIAFYPGNAPLFFAELFTSSDIIRARESYRAKQYIEKTKEKVMLSFPRVDIEGKETSSSNILEDLKYTEYYETTILDAKHFTANQINNIQATAEAEYNCKNRNTETAPNIISDTEVKKTVSDIFTNKSFSASQLERFAKCPYQYYLNKVAHLEPIEPPAPDIRPRHRGTIIHYIMELFFKHDLDLVLKYMRNEIEFTVIKEKIKEYTKASLEEHKELLLDTHPGLIEVFKSRAAAICIEAVKLETQLLLAMDYPMLPEYTEWEFGINESPPLEIKNEHLKKSAYIKGVIDRIDVDREANCFAVTDYKTGETSSIPSKIKKGEHLQIPIYIKAAKELLLKDLKPVTGFLFSLKKMVKMHGIGIKEFRNYYFKNINARLFSNEEEWNDLIDTAIEYAAKYIQEIRDSKFIENTKNCQKLCDYREICRYGK